MTLILDGKQAQAAWLAELKEAVGKLKRQPILAIMQVGHYPATDIFVARKKAFGEKVGVKVIHESLPAEIAEAEIIKLIERYNQDRTVHGIIIQLPLPPTISRERLVRAVDPSKDVDGLTPGSLFRPATARGILYLLDFFQIEIAGKRAVVVGRSDLVGKPAALALLERGATVTIAHKGTADLRRATREAEILVVAAGVPKLITAEHLPRRSVSEGGPVIVDVGITRLPGGSLSGDVDYEAVKGLCSAISPVPGGVGPMTVAALFANLIDAARSLC